MKLSVVVLLGGMLWTAPGCLGSAADPGEANEVNEVNEVSSAGEVNEASPLDESFEDVVARRRDDRNRLPNNLPVRDASGAFTTVSSHGFIDLDNEFFQDLGGNGRRCISCHVPTVGWTITPHQLKATFEETNGGAYNDGLGLSAVFRAHDGANSPNADVSTKAKRRVAYSMLLDKGLIRVGLAIPANAEFDLVAVDDPYHYASATELSLFRRPLPTTNLKFDSTVMWDGREVVPGAAVVSELLSQASDAVLAHAQGPALSAAQQASVVDFETALASAQITDDQAGNLYEDGANGGPSAILAQPFYIGINDNFGDGKTGAPFTANVFTLFDSWAKPRSRHESRDRGDRYDRDDGGDGGDDNGRHDSDRTADARQAIARGQALFNTKKIAITGVSGINDEVAFGKPATLMGSCSSCHDSPNGGSHSVVAPLDLGLVDASRRTSDMPLYTLRNKITGETVRVTDPGRAMVDGKWSHIGRFKGPILRNLAPRAPYFHNGFAADLNAVVDFYDSRFQIGFTAQEKSDLVAFLGSL